MANWMVAIDESEYALWAFNLAVSMMNIKTDTLFLYKSGQETQLAFSVLSAVGYEYEMEHRKREKALCKKTLRIYFKKAQEVGITPILIMGFNDHAGDGICRAVKEKGVHHLVLGRRDMHSLVRVFVGSTTMYCLTNAECNVVVAKKPFGAIEEHTPLQDTKDMEEIERQRRIREEEGLLDQEQKERQAALKAVKEAEEAERERRMYQEALFGPTEEDIDLEIYNWGTETELPK